MPHFYFNVHDGHDIPDEDGQELPNVDAAKVQAVIVAADMLRDHAHAFWRDGEWRLDVTDEAGTVLFSLTMIGADAPPAEAPIELIVVPS